MPAKKGNLVLPGLSSLSGSLTWVVFHLVQGSYMSLFFNHVKGIINHLADRYDHNLVLFNPIAILFL